MPASLAFLATMTIVGAPANGAPADDCRSSDPLSVIRGCTEVIELAARRFDRLKVRPWEIKPMESPLNETLDALRKRVYAWEKLSRLDDALRDCDLLIKLNRNYPPSYSLRGRIREKMRDHQGARADFDKTIEIAPHSSDSYTARADFFRSTRDYALALADLGKAAELSPSSAFPHLMTGIVLLRTEKMPAAIASFTKAVELAPLQRAIWVFRCRAFLEAGDADKAIGDCDRATSMSRDDWSAIAYAVKGDAERADFELAMAGLGDLPAEVLAFDHAEVLRLRGDQAGALLEYDRAIAKKADFVDAYLRRGMTYLAMKRLPEAVSDFSKVIEFDAHIPSAYRNRSFAYSEMGLSEKAGFDRRKATEVEAE
jgi:tetratricopeptide (TPR) repeat protein